MSTRAPVSSPAPRRRLVSPLPRVGPSSAWPVNLPATGHVTASSGRGAAATGKRTVSKTQPTGRRARAGRTDIVGGGTIGLDPGGAGGGVSIGGGRGVGLRFGELWGRSKTQATGLVRETLSSSLSLQDRVKGTRELVHWASAAGSSEQRRLMVQVFKEADVQPLFIHHLSELPADQAEQLMLDFFEGGGDEAAIAEWLVMAGGAGLVPPPITVIARRAAVRKTATQVRGKPVPQRGWLSDAWNSVVDWVSDAINTVVNAVVKAGKSLASVIGKLVSMTLDQLTQAARALRQAGRAVGELLGAAATQGIAFLQKMTSAAIKAAYAVAGVIGWLATQAAAAAKAVVQTLMTLGQNVLSLVKTAVTLGAAVMQGLLRALIAAGQGLAQIMAAVSGQLIGVIQPLVTALRAIGQTVRAIVIEAIKLAAATARLVLSALLALGTTLAGLLAEVAGLVAQSLKTVLQLLMQLGKGLAQLVAALASLTAAAVRAVVSALLALGQTLAALVLAAVQAGVQLARVVISALLALGRRVAEVLVAVAGRAVSALRTTLEALLALGQALGSLVKDIVTDVAEGFRRGFFEGLIALGKAPLELMRAAALGGVAVALLACTVLLELLGGHRPLTAQERAEATRIFGAAIDLDRVKIAIASLPADLIAYLNDDRPFTSMYIINFGSGATVETGTLIHELTHVWQGVQQGPLYMSRALEAQITAGLSALFHTGEYNDEAAYVVTDAMLTAAGGDFSRFNPEQQAWIVEQYWRLAFGGAGASGLPSVAGLEVYAKQVFKAPSQRPAARRAKPAARAATPRRRPGPVLKSVRRSAAG